MSVFPKSIFNPPFARFYQNKLQSVVITIFFVLIAISVVAAVALRLRFEHEREGETKNYNDRAASVQVWLGTRMCK